MITVLTVGKKPSPSEQEAFEQIGRAMKGFDVFSGASLLASLLCSGLRNAGLDREEFMHLVGAVWDGVDAYATLHTQPEGKA